MFKAALVAFAISVGAVREPPLSVREPPLSVRSAPVAPLAQFDHLVIAVRSLEEGVAEFERLTGIKAGPGGRHPGRGTENALVSLGGGKYLEIIAPQAGATLSPRD